MGSRGHEIGLAWIYIRGKRCQSLAQVLDRSLISGCRSIDQKQECEDEENAADHSKHFLYSLGTSCGGQCRISHLSTPARCPADSSLRGNVGRYFCVLLNSRLFEIFQLFARRDCVARFGVNANPIYPYVLPIWCPWSSPRPWFLLRLFFF